MNCLLVTYFGNQDESLRNRIAAGTNGLWISVQACLRITKLSVISRRILAPFGPLVTVATPFLAFAEELEAHIKHLAQSFYSESQINESYFVRER